MKKRITAFSFMLIFILSLFSGCSFTMDRVDNLIHPPKLTGENAKIQEAFENSLQNKNVSLETPSQGEYQSAFIKKDINNDGTQEAFVFYSDSTIKDNIVNMSVLKQIDGEWETISNVKGLGSSIDMVSFEDMNSDGIDEMITCWGIYKSKTNKIFSVYRFIGSEGSTKIERICSQSYSKLFTLDMNGDNNTDILTVTIDTSATIPQAKAVLYVFNQKKNEVVKLSETPIDGNVAGYSEIKSEYIDGTMFAYVDAFKGENGMITELLYWNNNTKALCAPLLDPQTQTTTITWRDRQVNTSDINGDGSLDIPFSEIVSGYNAQDSDDAAYFMKWMRYIGSTNFKAVQYTIYNSTYSYYLKIPSSWVRRITIVNNDNEIEVYRWNSTSGSRGEKLLTLIYAKNKNLDKYTENTGFIKVGKKESGTFGYIITDAGKDFGMTENNISSEFIYQ